MPSMRVRRFLVMLMLMLSMVLLNRMPSELLIVECDAAVCSC